MLRLGLRTTLYRMLMMITSGCLIKAWPIIVPCVVDGSRPNENYTMAAEAPNQTSALWTGNEQRFSTREACNSEYWNETTFSPGAQFTDLSGPDGEGIERLRPAVCDNEKSGTTLEILLPFSMVATALRLIALIISTSIICAWSNERYRRQMRLFLLHWASGLVYTSSQLIMSLMVLLCWSTRDALPIIYFLKFMEVASINLWAISSLAVALLIASIVKAFDHCRRVPAVIGSPRVLWSAFGVSMLLTVCSAISWSDLGVTGAYFWVFNATNERHNEWIGVSFALAQLVAGFLMSIVLVYITTGPRKTSLRVCCKTSQRIYFYLLLTILGTVIYLYNGISFIYVQLTSTEHENALVNIGWCSKYIHVIVDTLILMSAMAAQQRHQESRETSRSRSSGSGTQHGAVVHCAPSSGDGTNTSLPPNEEDDAESGNATVDAATISPTDHGSTSGMMGNVSEATEGREYSEISGETGDKARSTPRTPGTLEDRVKWGQ